MNNKHNILLTYQYSIGFNLLFYDYFSNKWIPTQHQYIKKCVKKENKQATVVIAAISIVGFYHIYQLWLLCNHHKHKLFTFKHPGYKKFIIVQRIKNYSNYNNIS